MNFKDVLIRPQITNIESRSQVNPYTKHAHYYGLPVIVSNLDTTGTITMSRVVSKHKIYTALHKYYNVSNIINYIDECQDPKIFITIGMNHDFSFLSEIRSKTAKDILINIDVSNGYMKKFHNFISEIRNNFPDSFIMAGNVCTYDGAMAIASAGADIVKCGWGSGGLCLSSSVTGVGNNQLNAIFECSEIKKIYPNKLICSDGGVKEVGDICKALGAGADLVMCGSLFLGYEESIESAVDQNGMMWAYGMSSERANNTYNGGLKNYRAAEGKEIQIKVKKGLDKLCQQIEGGIRSCLSITNHLDIKDFIGNADFNE